MAQHEHRLSTTTDAGALVESDEHSLTVGPDGPILLQDHYLIEQMANFNRERIPERQPHAKGGGAFGHFEVTNDVTAYTKAAVFQPGTRTDTLIRFSTVAGERGSPDTWRDPRGFALKFYTSEGNYDMVGNNTPVFFVRDPLKFQHFIRSQKRRADNNLRDHDMQWDFWTLFPESAHQVTWLMGDRGIPRSWRHMNGYSSHTYLWINAGGAKFWVKYHFKTDQGIEFFTQDEGDQMAATDTDYHQRDLYQAIERGEFPSWTLKMQIMPFEDAKTYRFNPFDLTKVWPHADYPLVEVGRLTLDRNVSDYHTEMEQAAFEPNNLVPGIALSPDKMLLARGFSYSDAHRARMGVNYKQIPVNSPKVPVHAYSKDGAMRVVNVSDPVYAPNSKGGPQADAEHNQPDYWYSDGDMVRSAYTLRAADDDWGQPGTLVREVLDDAARERLVSNIVGHLLDGVTEPVLQRAFGYWRNVDKSLGDRVEAGVAPARNERQPVADLDFQGMAEWTLRTSCWDDPNVTTAIQQIPLQTIDGSAATLGDYQGDVLLVVNVASKCGLTPQYEALERLYEEFRDRGFAVLGFPANDFAGQEPGSNEEIVEFCTANYGVQFPLFSKITVTGEGKHPLYAELTSAVPHARGDKEAFRGNLRGYGMTPTEDPEVLWNFEKFLVSARGEVVDRFAPDITPDDEQISAAIERELQAG